MTERGAAVAWVILAVASCAPDVTVDAARADGGDGTVEAAYDGDLPEALDARSDGGDRAMSDAAPAGDAAVDASTDDVVIDPGTCGQAVRDCLCGCGSDAACQSACIAGAHEDCQVCLYIAAMNCCPAEESAFGMCIDRYMCADQPCVDMNCGTEQSAYNTCFQRRQTSVPACVMEVQTCLGSDYPMVRCVMTR